MIEPEGSKPRNSRTQTFSFPKDWALEYHTLILFFLKEPLWNRSLYFFLPGYLKAQNLPKSKKLVQRVFVAVSSFS